MNTPKIIVTDTVKCCYTCQESCSAWVGEKDNESVEEYCSKFDMFLRDLNEDFKLGKIGLFEMHCEEWYE